MTAQRPVAPFTAPEEAETMVYTVDLGDGRVVDVEGPKGATPEQLQQAVQGIEGSATTPVDQTDIGFGQEAHEGQNRPDRSAEYVAAMNAGVADGSIASSEDAIKLAAEYGQSFPDRAALDRAFEALKRGVPFGGTGAPEYPVDISDRRGNGGAAETADVLARGVAGAFGLDDEIDALRRTAFEGEDYGQALADARAIRNYDQENSFGTRLTGELLGGIAIPASLEATGVATTIRAVGLSAGRNALRSGATLQEARAMASRAITGRLAREGAAYGGVAGVAGTDGGLTERATGGAIGAGVGAVGAAALGAVGGAAASRADLARQASRATPQTDAQRVAAAAARQGVDVLPADVAGPTTRRLTAAAVAAPVSAAPIINRGQLAVEQSRGVRDRVASAIGTALYPEAAGETATSGARAFIQRTSGRGGALYDAAEQASNGVIVAPNEALRVLNRNIAELRDTPGGAEPLARLEAIREELQNGAFSVAGVRRMRSVLRDEFVGQGIRGTDLERRINQVIDAAADDVAASLNMAGRQGVARQFQVADRYWRNRIRTIDDHLAPIIGKEGEASGEQIVQRLETASRANNRRLIGFLNALPAAEQADVRASLIGRLGRATSGAQNDAGDAFSLATFLSQWDKIGETAKARLFGGEGRAALNDLATVASGARRTAEYANKSQTAGAIAGQAAFSGAAGLAGLPTFVATMASQYGLGRLLASPRFARWLGRPPRNSAGLQGYVERLTRIARAEPAIADNVLALQNSLRDGLRTAPARMAAEEPEHEASIGDGQRREQQAPQQRANP